MSAGRYYFTAVLHIDACDSEEQAEELLRSALEECFFLDELLPGDVT